MGINKGDSIQIEYLGYKSLTLPVKENMGTISLVLENQVLSEVVVTSGYQSILKERVTGSYVHVGQDVLAKRPVSDLSAALQGQVAGLQGKENADGTVSYLIRGTSSMYANASPLVVVDGFPIANNNFSSINPNDVESVDFLKDAAASSIWGARSANGVIVVTTKKGKGKSGLTITGSMFSRISQRTDLNQLLNTASAADMVAYERLAYQNKWTFAGQEYQGGVFPADMASSLTLAQEMLYANQYGRLSAVAMQIGLDSLSQINNHDQIQQHLLRRAIVNQYNVSMSNNSERSKTYASLLFEDNDSRYQGTGYKRYNINLSNEYKLTKFLNFNFGVFLQHNSQKNSGVSNAELQNLSPYETLLNPDGTYSVNLGGSTVPTTGAELPRNAATISYNTISSYNRYMLSQLPLDKFPYSDLSYNVLREVRARDLRTEEYLARIQTGFNIKLLEGLDFTTSLQYERSKRGVNNFYGEDGLYVRGMVNRYVQYNNTTKTVGPAFLPKGGIEHSVDGNTSNYIFRNQLNFNRNFGKHNIQALTAMEISQYRTDTRFNPWLFGYYPEKLQSTVPLYGYGSPVDLINTYTSAVASSVIYGGATTLSYDLYRYVSLLGNMAYTYDGRYTLSASVRSDASNFITENTALRWSPFWHVGGKWNIRAEDFAQDMEWLDRLNLRATYGRNGNTDLTTSTNTLLNVSTAPNANTNVITATISDNGNPTLRWEKTTTTNIALDYSLFRGKLFGAVDYYNKVGTDLTGLITLAGATGTTSQKFNNAGITNHGVEIELGTQGAIGHTGLSYSTSLNYAYNQNRVNDLYVPSLLAWQLTQSPGTNFVEGRPTNSAFSYEYLGMQDGIPRVAGLNGTTYSMSSSTGYQQGPAQNFLLYQGTFTPPHTLGYKASISYHNFSLNALFIGTFGGVYRNPVFNYSSANIGGSKTQVNKWVSEVLADSPEMPGFPQPNEVNQYLWNSYATYLSSRVESSSYIQCKDLYLDYSLPESVMKRLKLQSIQAFIQSNNVGMVWVENKRGYNPDWLPGTDRPMRTLTLGVNVGF